MKQDYNKLRKNKWKLYWDIRFSKIPFMLLTEEQVELYLEADKELYETKYVYLRELSFAQKLIIGLRNH